MRIFFAGHATGYRKDALRSVHRYLGTFAYPKYTYEALDSLRPGTSLLCDSGAFTAHASGEPFEPEAYAAWAKQFKGHALGRGFPDLHFFNLDVIGDQEGTWQNQRTLERLSLRPIPIVTYGADTKHLTRALDTYDFFALGGLVPYARYPSKLLPWLDHCFAHVLQYAEERGGHRYLPRVHLLGIAQDRVLKRYPAFSCDVSSWLSSVKYGKTEGTDLPFIPRQGDAETDHKREKVRRMEVVALRQYVENVKDSERQLTALWHARGVRFKGVEPTNQNEPVSAHA